MSLTLRQARRSRDVTQITMAELLDISPQTYSKLENNPDLITIAQAKKISEFLGVSYDEIFFCNPTPFKIESPSLP